MEIEKFLRRFVMVMISILIPVLGCLGGGGCGGGEEGGNQISDANQTDDTSATNDSQDVQDEQKEQPTLYEKSVTLEELNSLKEDLLLKSNTRLDPSILQQITSIKTINISSKDVQDASESYGQYMVCGTQAVINGNLEVALNCFLRGGLEKQEDATTLNNIAFVLNIMGDYEAAKKFLLYILKDEQTNRASINNLSFSYSGDKSSFLNCLRSVVMGLNGISIDPFNIQPAVNGASKAQQCQMQHIATSIVFAAHYPYDWDFLGKAKLYKNSHDPTEEWNNEANSWGEKPPWPMWFTFLISDLEKTLVPMLDNNYSQTFNTYKELLDAGYAIYNELEKIDFTGYNHKDTLPACDACLKNTSGSFFNKCKNECALAQIDIWKQQYDILDGVEEALAPECAANDAKVKALHLQYKIQYITNILEQFIDYAGELVFDDGLVPRHGDWIVHNVDSSVDPQNWYALTKEDISSLPYIHEIVPADIADAYKTPCKKLVGIDQMRESLLSSINNYYSLLGEDNQIETLIKLAQKLQLDGDVSFSGEGFSVTLAVDPETSNANLSFVAGNGLQLGGFVDSNYSYGVLIGGGVSTSLAQGGVYISVDSGGNVSVQGSAGMTNGIGFDVSYPVFINQ